MEKLLVIILISSALLTQCYTEYQYTSDEYDFNENNELISIILRDSTILDYGESKNLFSLKSDS